MSFMRKFLLITISFLLVEIAASWLMNIPSAAALPVTLSNVPAYNWYHGCGPTAAASVIGYWDLHGYDNLFDASGWDSVCLTGDVQNHISSPAHNEKYDPTPDNTKLPEPPDTSIADFFHTSEDPLGYGWSYQSFADEAFIGYADYRGYTFDAWYEPYSSNSTWDSLIAEIDAERPLMFLVDTDGNGGTDHFVPVLGYDPDNLCYGLYTTWSEDENLVWKPFLGVGNSWGVGYATFIQPLDPPDVPIPEPSTILLLAGGLIGLVIRRCITPRS